MFERSINLISIQKYIFLATCFFIASSCTHIEKNNIPNVLNEKYLSREMAEYRASLILSVNYELELDINKGIEEYSGQQKITFNLRRVKDIFLDFQEGEVVSTQVNNVDVSLLRGPTFIFVPKENLVEGVNSIRVFFKQKFSRDGVGLHIFQDPEDKSTYLYTQFEPFDASRMAPFFDQPDLKAKLKLTVKSPKEWEVIANTKIESQSSTTTHKELKFAQTKPISTYLYALLAGPFAAWSSFYNSIPLKIYARKSIAKYVPYQHWFEITKSGMRFFETYFGVAYPFDKYDQILVPEFNFSAMENVGAVTYTEKFVRRGGYTRTDRLKLASVSMHEMAHMWFGNLVTMKWWNDLWLNESFATYMSALALVSATEYKEAWVDFHGVKLWAYHEDEQITTHPIASVVNNTNEAFANFDGITYGKGASVMKELSLYLGPERFQNSLKNYFKKHAYKNTTISDFISVFEETSNASMGEWFKLWLETQGVDTVSQGFLCENNKTTLKLNFSEGSKPHALKVAGYRRSGNKVIKTHQSEVIFNPNLKNREIIQELRNVTTEPMCPEFIFANSEDHAYVKIILSANDLAFLKDNINLVSDPLTRLMLWGSLWHMVRDQKLKLDVFSEMALQALAQENDFVVLEYLAQKTVGMKLGAFDSLYYFANRSTPDERARYKKMTDAFENKLNERMKKSEGDMFKFFFATYAASINSEQGAKNVFGILTKINDPDARWKALSALCREGYQDIDILLEQELKKDRSETAAKNALACHASRPELAKKKELLGRLVVQDTPYSSEEVNRVSKNLFPAKQRELIRYFSEQIYTAIETTWPKMSESNQYDLAYELAPTYCELRSHEKLGAMLKKNKSLPKTIAKPLLVKYDDDRRCLAIREYNKIATEVTTH